MRPPRGSSARSGATRPGVAIITALGEDGPVGLTASSVASVAADPATISFSVSSATRSAGALLRASRLDVHLLTLDQAPVAEVFARSGSERFTPDQGWTWSADGAPTLPDALATLRCEPLTTVPVGGSTIVVATVLDVRLGPDAAPLVHHDRTFRAVGRPAGEVEVERHAGA
ncbi:MAG: flavin reductase family protein [Aeromicrobium erythreum]